jgi:hypothetical protein
MLASFQCVVLIGRLIIRTALLFLLPDFPRAGKEPQRMTIEGWWVRLVGFLSLNTIF